jgi:hypothetical protein
VSDGSPAAATSANLITAGCDKLHMVSPELRLVLLVRLPRRLRPYPRLSTIAIRCFVSRIVRRYTMRLWTRRPVRSGWPTGSGRRLRRTRPQMEAFEARLCLSVTRTYDSKWALTGITQTSAVGPLASSTTWSRAWSYTPDPMGDTSGSLSSIAQHQVNFDGSTSDSEWVYGNGINANLGELQTVTQENTQATGSTTLFEWNGSVASVTRVTKTGPHTRTAKFPMLASNFTATPEASFI